MKTNKQHGGKRKGAGFPALFDKPMKRVNLMLDEETRAIFRKIGNGNESAGAREAAKLIGSS
jgi:hypothetical protein